MTTQPLNRGSSVWSVVAILLSLCACTSLTSEPQPAVESPLQASLNAVFDEAVESGFSGVVLVRHRGEVLMHRAAGAASREENIPNETGTPLVIGSVTKQFTAAAILKLREDGLLSLDETLAEIFPDVPVDKAGITLHQLLIHTAGFPPIVGLDSEPLERDEFLLRAFEQPLEFEPSERHSYSNVGYSILAAIIELRSSQSYERFLRDSFFTPAQMSQTGFLLPNWDQHRPATGYRDGLTDVPLERNHNDSGYYWNLRGNGGLVSTAEDLIRWHEALVTNTALNTESTQLLATPHVDEGYGDTFYGYGWVVEDTEAGSSVWHDGGNGFFFSVLSRYVDADLQVVMLSNEDTDAAESLTSRLAVTVLPEIHLPETDWEMFYERDLELNSESSTIVELVEFASGEDHAAGITLFLTEGSGSWRVLDPSGNVFRSGSADTVLESDTTFPIDPQVGTWTFELELQNATGDLYMAWGKLL